MTINLDKAGEILGRAKAAAIDYYQLIGKPLGITREIGEYLAAQLLGPNLPTPAALVMTPLITLAAAFRSRRVASLPASASRASA